MGSELLVRLGVLGRDATPFEADVLAAEVGVDPRFRPTLVDLAALGVTVSAWRRGPVEDWHIAGRIPNPEMMRANAAISRRVRALLSEFLPERWWAWTVRTGLRTDALLLWSVVAREIGAVDRRLPNGRTVAELAAGDERLAEYERHVLWCRDRWAALTAEFGLRVAVLMLACRGAWGCRRWWMHPDWPPQVDKFITFLNEPDLHPNPKVAAAIPGLQRQGRLRDPHEIQQRLLAGPDLLDARLAADCLWNGLLSISPGDVCPATYGSHPEFVTLLEPCIDTGDVVGPQGIPTAVYGCDRASWSIQDDPGNGGR